MEKQVRRVIGARSTWSWELGVTRVGSQRKRAARVAPISSATSVGRIRFLLPGVGVGGKALWYGVGDSGGLWCGVQELDRGSGFLVCGGWGVGEAGFRV